MCERNVFKCGLHNNHTRNFVQEKNQLNHELGFYSEYPHQSMWIQYIEESVVQCVFSGSDVRRVLIWRLYQDFHNK